MLAVLARYFGLVLNCDSSLRKFERILIWAFADQHFNFIILQFSVWALLKTAGNLPGNVETNWTRIFWRHVTDIHLLTDTVIVCKVRIAVTQPNIS